MGASSGSMPTWLSGAAVNQWTEIPSSRLTLYANFPDAYFTGIGLLRPSTRANPNTDLVDWGTNKYGIHDSNWTNISWGISGGHTSYSGMMFNDLLSKVYVGGGDAHWAENSMHAFDYSLNTPAWTQSVIASTPATHWRTPSVYANTYPSPQAGGDDTRLSRHYDGGRRGGHSYFCPWFLRARNYLAFFGSHQYWPTDQGSDAEVQVGNLGTGLWLSSNPIGDRTHFGADELHWMQKHPITEDIYFWGNGGRLCKWDESDNTYSVILTEAGEDGVRLTGSIDWTNGYILFSGWIGTNSATKHHFMVDLASPAKVVVTMVGTYATTFDPYRNGGVVWCPNKSAHLYYNDDGFVYTVTKTGATEFTVERLTTTGTGPAASDFADKAGGVLNNWQFDRTLNGIICRPGDNKPMYFLRTA